MGSILRSILPLRSSKDDDDEYNVEYSFAMEYTGPPVSYDIPKAAPVDVGWIPTASVVSIPSVSDNLSIPVIHPIVERKPKLFASEVKDGRGWGSIGADAQSPGSSVGEGSTVSLEFSDSHGDSQESSLSSDGDGLPNDCHEIVEAGSSSEENGIHQEISGHDIQTQIVTFREPESSAMVQEESDFGEPRMVIHQRQRTSSHVKHRLCHRCLKGNRFTAKEICIVCDAKYCSNCVLRVMGAMPEGRKCTTCLGYPVDESKRRYLGKCSKVLKRLLTDFEIERAMHLEESCQVNQIPYWLVIVNGEPLSLNEVVLLRSCPNPPKRLEPGSYWYDKLSGFWGKEGHKPYQIITPELSVGGSIKEDASNGNTKVKINNRVITKAELLMLKFARINYKGCPHFWVSHDGSYQEEGQNQMKGNIWQKPGMKAICVLLSLPMPPQSHISSEEETVNKGSEQNTVDTKSPRKLLLVGPNQSGTSAIFKQAKILYNVPFSEDERQNVKSMIQCSMYHYLGILLEGRKQFEEEYSIQMRRRLLDQPGTSAAGGSVQNIETNIYSIGPKVKAFADWLLQIMFSGNLEAIFPASTREYSPLVEELWNDKGFQATYARRNELRALPTAANHFLPRAVEIVSTTYEPSDGDILHADGITSSNGLASMEFSLPASPLDSFMEPAEQNNPLQRYQLIRVNSSSLGENGKWLCMFEDVDLVLYCIDLTSYDEFYKDNNLVLQNKMLDSKNLFEKIVTHPRLKGKAFLLILNKFDLLEKKIKTAPLKQCNWFHDFNPLITRNTDINASSSSNNATTSVAQYGFQYIAGKFKRLFSELTGRKLYVSSVTVLEGDSVDASLRYGKEVLKWVDEENKPKSSVNEWSSESIETTL